jgi:hypothetical protein
MSKTFEFAVEGKKEKEKLVARNDIQAAAIAKVIKERKEAAEKKAELAKK